MVMRALLLVPFLAACTTTRTEVIVVTDTDLAVPAEVDQMRIDVTGPSGETQRSIATFTPGESPPPRVLGLLHSVGPLGPFRVVASAFHGTELVVERIAIFDFRQGETLVLRIDLSRSCIAVTCESGQTCASAACRSERIAPEELEPFTGEIPGADGSIGEVDAGPDAGCAPEACNGADDDCDLLVDEDFDLTSDPMRCGSCTNACSFQNATANCVDSSCVLGTCSTGFDNCDGLDSTGCEADLSLPEHCGDCATMCHNPTRDCCAATLTCC